MKAQVTLIEGNRRTNRNILSNLLEFYQDYFVRNIERFRRSRTFADAYKNITVESQINENPENHRHRVGESGRKRQNGCSGQFTNRVALRTFVRKGAE